jgi:hypothetical protein
VNWLSPRVYTPTVAIKFMATIAQGYQRGEAVFVLLTPTYRSIAVLGSGSGRPPGPAIRVRARRLVAKAFTENRRSVRAANAKARGSRPRVMPKKQRRSRPRK